MSAPAPDYEHAKKLVRDPDPAARLVLAKGSDTPPEMLYFLATDEEVKVRRAVAANPATPRQADTVLAKDADYGVRVELARKIVGDGLDGDERSQLWRMGFTILETLATDQMVRVRRALAEGLKHLVSAPRPIVTRLARDPEREVATPILRHSPVLTDDDLAEIVEDGAPDWAVSAVASRPEIGPRLARAIAAGGDVPAVTGMLVNERAEIPDATIEDLAERSREVEDWRAPLVDRPTLPGGAVLRLARFVSGPLLSMLRARKDLDAEIADKVDDIADSRDDLGPRRKVGKASRGARRARRDASEPRGRSWEDPHDRVYRLHQSGRLSEETVELALGSGDTDFVVAALSIRSGTPVPAARRIVESKSAKAITALCWKAGFKMRFAIDVQMRIARIQPGQLLYARDGHDYPLSPDAMTQQLALFAG